MVHHLDYFLFASRVGTAECHEFKVIFQQLAAELGVPLAAEKTEEPTSQLSFLGIQ